MASKPRNWSEVTGRTTNRPARANTSPGWVRACRRRVWEPLAYSSAYLALLAAVKVLIVQYLLALPPSPAPVVVGLVTFAVYANDRIVDVGTDAASNPRRTAFVRRYRGPLYVLAAMAYGLGVALSAFGGPVAFGLALLPGGAWTLYALNWVPTGTTSVQRLKEVPVLNSVLVATAWAVTVVFVPLAFAAGPFTPAVALTPTVGAVLAYFALGTFVNTEISNVGDLESDRESGATTIPVVLGVERTRSLLYGLALLAAAVPGYAALGGHLSVTAAAALAVGPAFLIGVVWRLGRAGRENALTIAAECTRLPVFGVLAAVALV